MHDTTLLARLSWRDARGKAHKLVPAFTTAGGRFCDASGTLSAVKVRHVYMMAGIIPPESDAADVLLESIRANIVLLNAYAVHAGVMELPRPAETVAGGRKKLVTRGPEPLQHPDSKSTGAKG